MVGKLATKYMWIYGHFYSVGSSVDVLRAARVGVSVAYHSVDSITNCRVDYARQTGYAA